LTAAEVVGTGLPVAPLVACPGGLVLVLVEGDAVEDTGPVGPDGLDALLVLPPLEAAAEVEAGDEAAVLGAALDGNAADDPGGPGCWVEQPNLLL